MADYNGFIIEQSPLFGLLTEISFSGTVADGERDLILIDESTNEIVATTKSASNGSYSIQINGSTFDTYSVVCMPDRYISDENGDIQSKVIGISA